MHLHEKSSKSKCYLPGLVEFKTSATSVELNTFIYEGNRQNTYFVSGNVFNITGTGFHFGNNYTIQNQHNYGFPVAPQEKNKEKKSASVKGEISK